jgi:hypothetical protein
LNYQPEIALEHHDQYFFPYIQIFAAALCKSDMINTMISIASRMEKGVEISFQLNDDSEGVKTVEALADLTGYEVSADLEVDWRVFHVTLGENKFFKILYSGPKVTKLHPHNDRIIREKFDELAHLAYSNLMRRYEDAKRSHEFKPIRIRELKEEYDLWQDNFWAYF